MKNRIEEGDLVECCFTSNLLFSFVRDSRFVCKVLHTPQDTGDHYLLQYGTILFNLNPNCSEFVGMTLVDRSFIDTLQKDLEKDMKEFVDGKKA